MMVTARLSEYGPLHQRVIGSGERLQDIQQISRAIRGTTLLLVVLFFAFAGCVGSGYGPTASAISGVDKGAPVVYIHPRDHDIYRRASVGVLPFQVPVNHAYEQGAALAGLFRDVLLGKEVFPLVSRLDEPYGDFVDAIAQGRRAGVDLVLAGRLHRALEGTELGGARAELSIRLINVRTGNTVWHIAQAMDQPMDHHDIGVWNRVKESFTPPEIRPSRGAPPLANMLAAIAVDMAEVMTGATSVSR